MKILIITIAFFSVLSCSKNSNNYKIFSSDDYSINVEDRIVSINNRSMLGVSSLTIVGNYLILNEWMPYSDCAVFIYDKGTFDFVAKTAIIGKAPNEVIRAGGLNNHFDTNKFWLTDNGRNVIWEFNVDSVLNNSDYKPQNYIKFDRSLFFSNFSMISDSILLGLSVHPTSTSSFRKEMTCMNIGNPIPRHYGYQHPDLTDNQTKSSFVFLSKHDVYARAYSFCDLLTICNVDGTLRCIVRGKGFDAKDKQQKDYFMDVQSSNNFIVASYNGGNSFELDKHQRMETTWPTKLLVFDVDGNHLATIETGMEFMSFCIDEQNHRVICYFNGTENPLGYFNFDFEKELKN